MDEGQRQGPEKGDGAIQNAMNAAEPRDNSRWRHDTKKERNSRYFAVSYFLGGDVHGRVRTMPQNPRAVNEGMSRCQSSG